MKMKKTLVFAFYVSITFVFSGCGDRILLYPGKRLPLEKVAYLGTDKLTTLKIDGKTIIPDPDKENVISIELLPGVYGIEWTRKLPNATFTYTGGGTLNAEAGKTYMFFFGYLPGETTVRWRPENMLYGEHITEVKEHATWIQELQIFGVTPKVVVGYRPPWAD